MSNVFDKKSNYLSVNIMWHLTKQHVYQWIQTTTLWISTGLSKIKTLLNQGF